MGVAVDEADVAAVYSLAEFFYIEDRDKECKTG